jgi:hypothetical protein
MNSLTCVCSIPNRYPAGKGTSKDSYPLHLADKGIVEIDGYANKWANALPVGEKGAVASSGVAGTGSIRRAASLARYVTVESMSRHAGPPPR